MTTSLPVLPATTPTAHAAPFALPFAVALRSHAERWLAGQARPLVGTGAGMPLDSGLGSSPSGPTLGQQGHADAPAQAIGAFQTWPPCGAHSRARPRSPSHDRLRTLHCP